MITVSQDYKDALAAGNRNFYVAADITFWNGDTLSVDDENIWQGGFRVSQAVSDQTSFTIGSCIINKFTLILNNLSGAFDAYDFSGAKIVASFGLYDSDGTLIDMDGNGATSIQKGEYFVDEIETSGSLITLTCLDAMVKLDRNFSEVSLAFPATLQQIVTAVCAKCGVPYSQASFPNSTYSVSVRPSDDQVTCRDVLAMVCEIACCYGTIDRLGSLSIDYFDTDFMETIVPVDDDLDGGSFWVNVDSADGGSFWNFTDVHDSGTFIQQTAPDYDLSGFFKFNHDVNDVRITGAKLTQNGITYLSGSDRYTVSIQNNLLINSGDEAAVIADIASKLIGCGMRPFSAEHLADPTIEAGDAVTLTDHLGNTYRSVITQTEFSVGERQRTDCDAESYVSNQSIRYTSASKAVADYNVSSASNLVANAFGLYRSSVPNPQASGTTDAVHNASTFETSTFAMINNENGLQVGTRANASANWTWTAADAAEGAGLAEVLSVVGINADWINTGTLKLGGALNQRGLLQIYDLQNNLTGRADNNGLHFYGAGQVDFTIEPGSGYSAFLRVHDTDNRNISSIGAAYTQNTSRGYIELAELNTDGTRTGMFLAIDPATGIGFYNDRTSDTGTFSPVFAVASTGQLRSAGSYNATISSAANLTVISGGMIYRSTSSSRRYKEDITEELGELDPNVLYDLKVVKFKFKDGYISEEDERYGKDVIGFIAEDVDELYPIAVRHEDGQAEMWESNYMIPAMLKLIQEQKKQIDALNERVKALEERSR